MKNLTITNKNDEIIVCLYFDKDGHCHPDSWTKTDGKNID